MEYLNDPVIAYAILVACVAVFASYFYDWL